MSRRSGDWDGLGLLSVPAHERPYLARLPGAVEGPARILSVMIHDRLTEEGLAGVEAIITRSDGFDHLPATAMQARGIPGYHLEGYATDSVAQHTVMMLLGLARRLPQAMASTRTDWGRDHLVGDHLPDLRVGVIGLGRIGSRVVEILDALGVPTVGHDIDPGARVAGRLHRNGTLDEVLQCDAVTLHVPATPATHRLIDAAVLATMPRGALLVNTARGDLVDTEAVREALDAGHLGGFAADVLPGEPAAPERGLLADRDDVILTPHLGAQNHAAIAARYAQLAQISRALLDGRPDDVAAFRVI